MRGRRHRDRRNVEDILCFLERISKTIDNKCKPLYGMLESRGLDNPHGKADNATRLLQRALRAAIADLVAADRELALGDDSGK